MPTAALAPDVAYPRRAPRGPSIRAILPAARVLSARFLLRGLAETDAVVGARHGGDLRSGCISPRREQVGATRPRSRGQAKRRAPPTCSEPRWSPAITSTSTFGVVLRRSSSTEPYMPYTPASTATRAPRGYSAFCARKRQAAPFDLVHHRRREMRRVGHFWRRARFSTYFVYPTTMSAARARRAAIVMPSGPPRAVSPPRRAFPSPLLKRKFDSYLGKRDGHAAVSELRR